MKAVMFAINKPHTDNIKIGLKISELRTRPPKIKEPYKALIYETMKFGGCGKVIGEFTAYNEHTWRICMGIPKHLTITACVSADDIMKYTNNGYKDLTEISITDLKIYDKPKELSEFYTWKKCTSCKVSGYESTACKYDINCKVPVPLNRPPQSWCYVYEWSGK